MKAGLAAVGIVLVGAGSSLFGMGGGEREPAIRAFEWWSVGADTIPFQEALDIALLEAVDHGRLDRVSALLTAGANVNAAVGGDGSPLIVAAREGERGAVELLLERGADPNLGVRGDGNPLIVAAREGHAGLVTLLLDRGADPNAIVGGDGSPLIMAAREGHLGIVETLLDRGADIDQVAPGDENALIQASAQGELAVVELLVARGADVNSRVWVEQRWSPAGGEWRTPLNQARRNGHEAVERYLLSVGARD